MALSKQSFLSKFALAMVVVGVSAVAGNYLGEANSRRKARADREIVTSQVLRKVNAVQVGKKLPDHVFRDLELKEIRLSSVISGKSVVSILSPSCGACDEQLGNIAHGLPLEVQEKSVIFITSYHPPKLSEIRDSLHLKAKVLFDYGNIFTDSLSVYVFPFNIMVDSDLTITDIIVGPIGPSDYLDAL